VFPLVSRHHSAQAKVAGPVSPRRKLETNVPNPPTKRDRQGPWQLCRRLARVGCPGRGLMGQTEERLQKLWVALLAGIVAAAVDRSSTALSQPNVARSKQKVKADWGRCTAWTFLTVKQETGEFAIWENCALQARFSIGTSKRGRRRVIAREATAGTRRHPRGRNPCDLGSGAPWSRVTAAAPG
jgi:hypothetical protein